MGAEQLTVGAFTRVRLTLFSGSGNGDPLVGATVLNCNQLDPLCMAPIQTYVTDDGGSALVSLRADLPNYLEVREPGLVPTLVHIGPFPVEAGAEYQRDVIVPSWQGLSMSSIVPDPDRSRAHVVVQMDGCPGWDSSGVSLALPDLEGSVQGPFYVRSGGLEATSLVETSTAGRALFLDVETGDMPAILVRLTATDTSTGAVVAERNELSRPGAVSYVFLNPLRHVPIR